MFIVKILKHRFLVLCFLIVSSLLLFYINYVPYDYAIGALSSIYSRCGTPPDYDRISRQISQFTSSGRTIENLSKTIQRKHSKSILTSNVENPTPCQPQRHWNLTKWNNESWSDHPWTSVYDRKLVAYSAYVAKDDSNNDVIRVLALKHLDECRPIMCYFHIRGGVKDKKDPHPSPPLITMGTYDLIRLDCWWDCQGFESFYVDCPLPSSTNLLNRNDDPSSKAISIESISSVSLLPLHSDNRQLIDFSELSCLIDTDQISRYPRISIDRSPINIDRSSKNHADHHPYRLTMCVAPMFDWIDYEKLIIFIEYYRSQGADRFVIYHRSWSVEVQRVIEYYQRHQQPAISLEVIDWPRLPRVDDLDRSEINVLDKHVSYNGQVLAMNDCNLRERQRSRFVAHLDVDEFIVLEPADQQIDNRTLWDLLIEEDRGDVGSYVFEHVRVYSQRLAPIRSDRSLDHEDARSRSIIGHFNASKIDLLRSPASQIDRFPTRPKSIVKPETIRRQGVHFVWTHEPGYGKSIIDDRKALFYHITSTNGVSIDRLDQWRRDQTRADAGEMRKLRRLIGGLESKVNWVKDKLGLD